MEKKDNKNCESDSEEEVYKYDKHLGEKINFNV
jgi:hypothetical protein